jgi:hypothetical protein
MDLATFPIAIIKDYTISAMGKVEQPFLNRHLKENKLNVEHK